MPRQVLTVDCATIADARALLAAARDRSSGEVEARFGGAWSLARADNLDTAFDEGWAEAWLEVTVQLHRGLRAGALGRLRWEADEPDELHVDAQHHSRLEEYAFPAMLAGPAVAAGALTFTFSSLPLLVVLAAGAGCLVGMLLYATLADGLVRQVLSGPRRRGAETVDALFEVVLTAARG